MLRDSWTSWRWWATSSCCKRLGNAPSRNSSLTTFGIRKTEEKSTAQWPVLSKGSKVDCTKCKRDEDGSSSTCTKRKASSTNLRRVSIKASAKRAPSSKNSAPSSSKTSCVLRRRMLPKRSCQASFLHKVASACLRRLRTSVNKTICGRQVMRFTLQTTTKRRAADRTILKWGPNSKTMPGHRDETWWAEQGKTSPTRCISS